MNMEKDNIQYNCEYKQYFKFLSNPMGNAYKELLELMFSIADTFILVVRYGIYKYKSLFDILDALSEYQYKIENQSFFAETRLYCGDVAKVYYFRTNPKVMEILLSYSNSLYDWVHPKFPEDLSFLIDDTYLMTSTAHAVMGSILINESSLLEKLTLIDGLKGELR